MVKPNITKHISYSSKSSRNLRWLFLTYPWCCLIMLPFPCTFTTWLCETFLKFAYHYVLVTKSTEYIDVWELYTNYVLYFYYDQILRVIDFYQHSDKNKLHLIYTASNSFNGLNPIPRFIVCACKDILPSCPNPASKQKMLQTLFLTTSMSERWS